MSYEARCPQCEFVTHQLGHPTPCLLHITLPSDDSLARLEVEQSLEQTTDYDEPYAFGEVHPTVDRPGPFTIREYVRLRLLRSRIQASPSALDQPARGRSLSRR
jgi:hypothetical protein